MGGLDSPASIALVTIIISTAVIGLSKWDVFYDRDRGSLRDFGIKEGETLFPAWMAMFAAGYIVYMMAYNCNKPSSV